MVYSKTQYGWTLTFILAILLVGASLLAIYDTELNTYKNVVLTSIGIPFVIIILLFYKLTIEVDETTLYVKYGIGLIKFKFPIEKLKEVEVTRTKWFWGLGIRFTPKGMLYNIQGLKAVRINFMTGGKPKVITIGSDEPEELKDVLVKQFK